MLRHVVLFAWKAEITPEKIKEIELEAMITGELQKGYQFYETHHLSTRLRQSQPALCQKR